MPSARFAGPGRGLRPAALGLRATAGLLAFVGLQLGTAVAADYTWTSGDYGAAVGQSPIAVGDRVLGVAGGAKNFAGIALDNQGTILWETTDRIGFSSATVTNSGLFDLAADAAFETVGPGASSLVNQAGAVLRKSGGAGIALVREGLGFVNRGTIDVAAGSIEFRGSDGFAPVAGTQFLDGTRFTGAGVARVTGDASFGGTVTSENLELAAGMFGTSNARLAGSVRWTGGNFFGIWAVLPGQTLVGQSGGVKYFNGADFRNGGTIVWDTADPMAFVGTRLFNDGLLDIRQDADLSFHVLGGSTVINQGTLRKSGGAGTSHVVGIAVEGAGTIEALSGTLSFQGAAPRGEFWYGGTITGTAIVQAAAIGVTGTIAPGTSIGTLTVDGDLYLSGTFEVEVGGTADFDRLVVTGGTRFFQSRLLVRRTGGYLPRPGDSFVILRHGGRLDASEIDRIDAVGWDEGVQFGLHYGADAIVLSVTAVPEPRTYALTLAGLGFVVLAARRRRERR